MERIYSEEYKGHTIEIFPDYNSESPNDWGDTGAFLVCEHREMTAKRDGFDMETVGRAFTDCKDEDGEEDAYAARIAKDFHIFPIEAYIHSGIVLHFDGGAKIDRAWDVSGGFGFILVSREEAKDDADGKRIASGILETWNDYLSGNVYGYTIDDGDSGSVWGYYGDYEENALSAAREDVDTIGPEDFRKQVTRKRLDELKRWEMSLSCEERDAIARSVKSIEKQLSTLAGN